MMKDRQPSTRSQQLVFTLYGDYLRDRSTEVWTGSLIELLGPLGLSAQAVRSTLSRMSRHGWLRGQRQGRHSFYHLTPKSVRILDEGAQRLFPPAPRPWDGQWHILAYTIPERRRQLRDRLRQRLIWFGFGRLNAGTWISPYAPPPEVVAWLESTGAKAFVDLFTASHLGYSDDRQLVAHAWDLEGLNKAYGDFLRAYELEHARALAEQMHSNGHQGSNTFVRRFQLTLAYLAFPYVDPGLPPELLPADWLGDKAAALFQDYHALLTGGANSFVDGVLAQAPLTITGSAAGNGHASDNGSKSSDLRRSANGRTSADEPERPTP